MWSNVDRWLLQIFLKRGGEEAKENGLSQTRYLKNQNETDKSTFSSSLQAPHLRWVFKALPFQSNAHSLSWARPPSLSALPQPPAPNLRERPSSLFQAVLAQDPPPSLPTQAQYSIFPPPEGESGVAHSSVFHLSIKFHKSSCPFLDKFIPAYLDFFVATVNKIFFPSLSCNIHHTG